MMYDQIKWRRRLINERSRRLWERRSEAANIINRVYNTITDISLSLDSRHGLQDVDLPPSFENYLNKKSLGQEIFLQELLLVLQNQDRL